MHPPSYYKIQVLETFSALHKAMQALGNTLLSETKRPAWMQPLKYPTLHHDSPHQAALNLIQQLQYQEGQEGREILIGVGLFAVSQSTYEQVQDINKLKAAFKYSILTLKAQNIKNTDEWLALEFEALLNKTRNEYTQDTLTRTGLSRLHLKQCYRQIPLLSQRPSKVTWSWANTRSIKKITKQDAIALLQKKGSDEGIQDQIQRIEALDKEEQLAIVQTLCPHLRTNIVMDTPEGVKRFMLKGSLPLFYVDDGQPLPECCPPKIQKQSERAQRNDVRLDPQPFAPAIRAHRYVVGPRINVST
jgi:hypothetical protein